MICECTYIVKSMIYTKTEKELVLNSIRILPSFSPPFAWFQDPNQTAYCSQVQPFVYQSQGHLLSMISTIPSDCVWSKVLRGIFHLLHEHTKENKWDGKFQWNNQLYPQRTLVQSDEDTNLCSKSNHLVSQLDKVHPKRTKYTFHFESD